MSKTMRFVILLMAFTVLVAFGTSTPVLAKQGAPGGCWGKVIPFGPYAYISDLGNWPRHTQHELAVSVESPPGVYSFHTLNYVHVFESWNGRAGPFNDLGYFGVSYGHPVSIGDYTIYQIAPTTGGGDIVHFTDWIKSCYP